MDFYKKKLKSTKFQTNDNLPDLLNEVERKYESMQPIIQDPATDKSKVQTIVAEIRAQVDSLQNSGAVSEEQQQRIKEITRKCKDASVKYSNVPQSSAGIRSPKLFRKRVLPEPSKEPAPQNKVVLGEVEEKLKCMRQKRLDRLSTFVAEQSKLSEERSHQNETTTEMEDAIKSIQKTETEKKSFKIIVEEKVIKEVEDRDVRGSPRLGRHGSNESADKFKNAKPFSRRKFINKLNCTTQVDYSSTEDLTADSDSIKSVPFNRLKSEEVHIETFTRDNKERSSAGSKAPMVSLKPRPPQRKIEITKLQLIENLQQNSKATEEMQGDSHRYSPLLSPVGKQRKAIYLYENECAFLDTEKRSSLPSLTTFRKEETVVEKDDISKKHHSLENTTESGRSVPAKPPQFGQTFGKVNHQIMRLQSEGNTKPITKQVPSAEAIDLPRSNKIIGVAAAYENVSIETANDKIVASEKDRNNTVVIPEQRKSEPVERHKHKHHKFNKAKDLILNTDINVTRKSNGNFFDAPRSPMPTPRRNNYPERVLKKLQRNWDSVSEILENDSDVDYDEIEDLKKTLDEANVLLTEYKTRVRKLEGKSKKESDTEKLSDIRKQLEVIKEDIAKFRGLRRDSTYKQLGSRLSNYFLETNKISSNNSDVAKEKKAVLAEIDDYVTILELRVTKNEDILLEILDAQVTSIGTNCLCITKV